MALIATEGIILHTFNYLESSRIIRIITPDYGLISVIAKGARRARGQFGSAIDLFARGEASIYMKEGRDLQTLGGFEVVRSGDWAAISIERVFTASAIAEIVLRVAHQEGSWEIYDAISKGFMRLESASPQDAVVSGIGTAWEIISASGFSPSLDRCASCHREIPLDEEVQFSTGSGGTVCSRCLGVGGRYRRLPSKSRDELRAFLSGDFPRLDAKSTRAHQRLLREFIVEHLSDSKPLTAIKAWETI